MPIFPSELAVMEAVWESEGITASNIAKILKEKKGWARNTTYTNILKCIEKGYIERREPKFQCFSLVSRSSFQKDTMQEIVSDTLQNLFRGSVESFLNAFFDSKKLTKEECEKLSEIVKRME